MVLLVLTMGCMFIICLGIGLGIWATIKMQEEDINIERIIMFLIGIGVTIFGFFCTHETSIYYREKEGSKTEITTSISPQIDTIITIRNSVSDTSYIYKFNLTKE